MSPASPLAELGQALGEGLARPRHAWEALAIIAALVLAGVALLVVRARQRGQLPAAAASGAALLARLAFPVAALLLVWGGEALLRWRHVLVGGEDARLLHLAATALGAWAAVRLLGQLVQREFSRPERARRLERSLTVLAAVGVVLYATGVLGDVVAWATSMKIPVGTHADISLWSVAVGSATILVSILVSMWLGSLVEERLARAQDLPPNLRTVLGRVARAGLLVLAVLMALAVSGIDLTVLSVFGGALGVGLGLGLQRVASNYLSGFILLLDRSLRIGDVVTVDRFAGQVTQISTRYTVLRASDGTEAVVPNEMLLSLPVVNSTLANRRVCLSFSVAVARETDLAQALDLLVHAARAQPRVLADPPPAGLFREFQAGNVVIGVDFWIGDPEAGRQNITSDVALEALARLKQAGIVPAPPRTDNRA